MKFVFSHNFSIEDSFRNKHITSSFDIEDKNISQHFVGEIDIETKDWNIGLIVGSSGSGKTSISYQCFGKSDCLSWDNTKSIVDNFDKSLSINEIIDCLSSVGLNSAPCWLMSFNLLSNGEKMRAELARLLTEKKDTPIVFDEFTSVVDREVAKITSYSVQKNIRKKNKKFVAVSCHRDIIDWLNPDWVYDTDVKRFFFVQKNKDRPSKLILENVIFPYGECLKSIII